MQPAAPGHVAQAARGRRVWGKTDPQRPAPLAFRDGKAPCLAALAPCHAGGCGPGNGKMAANEKRGRRRSPIPQRDVRGLGAATCRPPGRVKNVSLAARAPGSWGWGTALFGCAGARRAGGCGPGNDKMAANEKRGRRRSPIPQRDVRGLGAATCRPNSCQ